jgi:transglutaminase-like putative cysteine protease
MKTGQTLWFLMAAAIATGCAGGGGLHFEREPPPPSSAYPDAQAVVLLDETRIDLHPGPKGEPVADVTDHKRVLLRRPGAEALAEIRVHYWKAFSEVRALHVRTTDPDGKVRTFGLDRAIDTMAQSNAYFLYNDERVRVIHAAPTLPGTTIEWTATVRYHEPRLFQFTQLFGDRFPVGAARLVVTAPRAWEVQHLARRMGEDLAWDPRVEDRGGRTLRIWEARDLAPLTPEELGPALAFRAPLLRVRLAAWAGGTSGGDGGGRQRVTAPEDARGLSVWLNDLVSSASQPTPEIAATAARVLADVPNVPRVRAQRLYSWVRDHITYCYINVGYGAWRPHRATEVLGHQYGDCKDKANLLKSLLAASQIPSRLAAIHNHQGVPERFTLPTVTGNFNHMILLVDLPGGPVAADPTSRTTPFGQLPVSDQDADLLPISPEGSSIVRAPSSGEADNAEDLELELELLPEGPAEGSFQLSSTGDFADRRRLHLLEAGVGERPRLVQKWVAPRAEELSLGQVEALDPPEIPTPLRVAGRLRMERGLSRTGAMRLVRLADLFPTWVPPLSAGPRQSPVVLRCRRQQHLELRLKLGPGREVPEVPPEVALDTRYGSYRLRYERQGEALRVVRTLTLREPVVPPEGYRELKQFFDDILAAEARAVVIEERKP